MKKNSYDVHHTSDSPKNIIEMNDTPKNDLEFCAVTS